MKLTVLQKNLSSAVSSASRIASPKAQLPVLGNLLLNARKEKLLISSTNLEISLSITVGAKVEREGDITIPARVFNDLVNNLNSGQIELQSSKENLQIKSDNFSSSVAGMNSSDFPEIPRTITSAISVSGNLFMNSLDEVLFAVSVDETRPVLTGVLIIIDENTITMVATDGFRLSKKVIKIKEGYKASFIIPKNALSELSRLSTEDEIKLSFERDEKQVLFGMENIVLASRIIEGEFPDFDRIIPKDNKYKVNIDKQDLLRAVKLASVFARDAANVVKFTLREKSIGVSAESSASGSQEGSVDAKVDGFDEEMVIAFNYRFIEDFIGSVDGDSVNIELNGSDAPGVFKDPEVEDYLHLIMPVKI